MEDYVDNIESDEEINDDENTARCCRGNSIATLTTGAIFNLGNIKNNISPLTGILALPKDIIVTLCEYLSFDDQLSFFLASNQYENLIF